MYRESSAVSAYHIPYKWSLKYKKIFQNRNIDDVNLFGDYFGDNRFIFNLKPHEILFLTEGPGS